jgi:AraC-like DNA-binding protein
MDQPASSHRVELVPTRFPQSRTQPKASSAQWTQTHIHKTRLLRPFQPAFCRELASKSITFASSNAAWHDFAVATRPVAEQRLRDLALLRRVRDRIDREYAKPLDVESLARDAHISAGHLSREFRLAYGESPYSYLMTRRIERAMALLRRGDLSVTEVCFAVGSSSLGTFSTRFTELVGMPPSTYRGQAARSTTELPACVSKQVTRPIRNREALAAQTHLP